MLKHRPQKVRKICLTVSGLDRSGKPGDQRGGAEENGERTIQLSRRRKNIMDRRDVEARSRRSLFPGSDLNAPKRKVHKGARD